MFYQSPPCQKKRSGMALHWTFVTFLYTNIISYNACNHLDGWTLVYWICNAICGAKNGMIKSSLLKGLL